MYMRNIADIIPKREDIHIADTNRSNICSTADITRVRRHLRGGVKWR